MPSPTAGLSFFHLHSLAVAAAVAATGAVPPLDLAFPLLALPYAFLLSRLAFPRVSPSPPPRVFPLDCRPLLFHVSAGAVVGLLLPALYVLRGAIAGGSHPGPRAAAPPLFLMASQVFAEIVASARGFSVPARAAVPVIFNAYRLRAIWLWTGAEEEGSPGRALALANMAFWSFNLFAFLVPFYLPRSMKIYYQNKEEVQQ